MNRHVIGVDVGGTKTECALIEIKGDTANYLSSPPKNYAETFRIVERKKIATERHQGYTQIVAKIAQLITDTCQKHSVEISALQGIGIGVPGAIASNMKMLNGNTLALIGEDLRADLCQALSYEGQVVCENDANCFVFAEALSTNGLMFHHERNVPLTSQIAVGLILGTGLGGGLFCHGKIFRGKHTSAFEVGHRVFQKDGEMCYCGRRGCTEQYLSGTALEAHFSRRLYSHITQRMSAPQIFALADEHEPTAVAVINQYRANLAQLIADLSNVLDPHYIVLGGGISTQPRIYQDLDRLTQHELFVKEHPPLIAQNRLGDSSGVFGAALLPLFAQDR